MKIQELRQKLEEFKTNEINHHMPKWWQRLQEMIFTSQIEKLEAIKNRSFQVSIELEIYCKYFGSKKFPVTEFELTDKKTVECAMLEFKKPIKEL